MAWRAPLPPKLKNRPIRCGGSPRWWWCPSWTRSGRGRTRWRSSTPWSKPRRAQVRLPLAVLPHSFYPHHPGADQKSGRKCVYLPLPSYPIRSTPHHPGADQGGCKCVYTIAPPHCHPKTTSPHPPHLPSRWDGITATRQTGQALVTCDQPSATRSHPAYPATTPMHHQASSRRT